VKDGKVVVCPTAHGTANSIAHNDLRKVQQYGYFGAYMSIVQHQKYLACIPISLQLRSTIQCIILDRLRPLPKTLDVILQAVPVHGRNCLLVMQHNCISNYQFDPHSVLDVNNFKLQASAR
jgi:hypothetical protein